MARFYWRRLLRRTREIAQFIEILNDFRQQWNERGMSARNFAAAPLLAQLSQRGQRVLALPWGRAVLSAEGRSLANVRSVVECDTGRSAQSWSRRRAAAHLYLGQVDAMLASPKNNKGMKSEQDRRTRTDGISS